MTTTLTLTLTTTTTARSLLRLRLCWMGAPWPWGGWVPVCGDWERSLLFAWFAQKDFSLSVLKLES